MSSPPADTIGKEPDAEDEKHDAEERYEVRVHPCSHPDQSVILSNAVATPRASRVVTVSVPPDAARAFEEIADAEGRNKSELFREMLRVYRVWRETERFESLQRYGAAQARRIGIKTERDVQRLIQEHRRG
jgi:Ribbon-helix-helix protein, copG family